MGRTRARGDMRFNWADGGSRVATMWQFQGFLVEIRDFRWSHDEVVLMSNDLSLPMRDSFRSSAAMEQIADEIREGERSIEAL